jgi:hypothetical protein
MAGQPGFFDLDERYKALSAAGDPLERLPLVVDFERFRPFDCSGTRAMGTTREDCVSLHLLSMLRQNGDDSHRLCYLAPNHGYRTASGQGKRRP